MTDFLFKDFSTQLVTVGAITGTAPITVTEVGSAVTIASTTPIPLLNAGGNSVQYAPFLFTFIQGAAIAYTPAYSATALISTFTVTPYENNTNSQIAIFGSVGGQQYHAQGTNTNCGSALAVYSNSNLSVPICTCMQQTQPATNGGGPDYLTYDFSFAYTQTSGAAETFTIALWRINGTTVNNRLLGTSYPWTSFLISLETLL